VPTFEHGHAPTISLAPGTAWLVGIAIVGYAVALLVVSFYAARSVRTEADYVVAGRGLSLVLVAGTLVATWFDAATMFAASSTARDHGLLGVTLNPFAAAGALVLAGLFVARPLWKMQLYTMADFYRRTYGPAAEAVGACIQVPAYFSWVALQYVALARILDMYFGLPQATGVVIVATITLVYTLFGGLWSVTLIDMIQIVIGLVGLVVLTATTLADEQLGAGDPLRGLVTVYTHVAASHPDHLRLVPGPGSAAAVLGWLAAWSTGLFGNLPAQDLQQRVFAARSPATAVWGCILAGIVYLAFAMLPVTLGLASLVIHPKGTLDPIGFMAGEHLSAGMLVVFLVSIMSIVLSTATSAVLAPATILGHNVCGRLPWFVTRPLLRERLCVVLVSLGSVAVAMGGGSLMKLLDVSLSIQLSALFVPMIMGLYGRPRGQLSAVLSMLLGFGAWLTAFGIEHSAAVSPAGVFAGVTALPASLWGLCGGVFGYAAGEAWLRSRGPGTKTVTGNREPV
jgi:SSS family solute:Na+ symporter